MNGRLGKLGTQVPTPLKAADGPKSEEARQAAALAAFQAASKPLSSSPRTLRRDGSGLSAASSTEANLGRTGVVPLPPTPEGAALREAAVQLLASQPGPEKLRRPGPWAEALAQAVALQDPAVAMASQAWAQGLVEATAKEVVRARSGLRLGPKALEEATQKALDGLAAKLPVVGKLLLELQEAMPGALGEAVSLAQSQVAPPSSLGPTGAGPAAPSPLVDSDQSQALKGEALEQRWAAYGQAAQTPMSPEAAARLQASAAGFLQANQPRAQAEPPPPLPKEEQGWFDRLVGKVASVGDTVVDALEDGLAAPSEAMAKALKDVPVLGPLAQGFAWTQRQGAQVVGGVLRGAGAMVEGVATMIAHPIDTVKGLATLASHIPMFPANPIRMVQAGWDIMVEGKPAMETLRNNLDPRIVLADDLNFAKGVVQAFAEPYTSAVAEGRYGEAVGRGIFEVATAVLTGGSTAGAKVAVEGAVVGTRVARAADVASDAARVARAADTAGDAARVARAADTAGDAARVARAADTAGDAARVARAADGASDASRVVRAADAASDAGRASEAGQLARLVGEGSDLAKAFPPSVRQALEESRALIRQALGEASGPEARQALSRSQAELADNLRFSRLDEAGKARELARIDVDAAALGRSLDGLPRGVEGRIAELGDVQRLDEVLELLKQRNPEALDALYRQSYEAFGVNADEAFQFIHDYTHSSSKVNKATFVDIGEAAKAVVRDTPLSQAEIANLSPRARVLKQMLDTRADRQAFLSEVLGLEPPAGYRVFRGTSNPETVMRVAEAWFKGDNTVAVTNRGITSTSLDPTVAVDFSRGGPRSVTVDPDVVRYLEEVKTNPHAVAPLREVAQHPTFVNFDLDVPNGSVVFDKYTDGGFSVNGTTAQRSQREVLIGGPQDSFLADARRAQVTYKGKTYMYEDREALLAALRREPMIRPNDLPTGG